MPSVQKYLTNFHKIFLWLKDEEASYCDWKFQVRRYFGFAIATLPLFQHPENVKFQFFPLHCPSRNAISSKVFNEFSKTFFCLKDARKVAIVVENFKCADIWFCNSNVTTFPTTRKCKNFNFSLYTIPAEMLYLQKYLPNFQNLSFSWKILESGYCGWKFQVRRYSGYCNSNVTTFATSRICKNFNFSF